MQIMRQHTDHRYEDCLVTDNVMMLSVFGVYVIGVIRKYDKDDEPLEFRHFVQFEEVNNAIDYYNQIVDNREQR